MARDRQRAKARKQRQAPRPPSRTDGGNGGDGDLTPDVDHLHRENVAGPWEHGGEVDRFEAELVAGAGGEPATDPDAAERASTGEDDLAEEPPAPVDDPVTEPGIAATAGGAAEPLRGQGGNRFLNFLRASWAELQRVQWPDRRQVGQATMVVLGFLVVAGAFLGAADFLAQALVDFIL